MTQENLVQALLNLTTTENDAVAFKSTLDSCLDFFFQVIPKSSSADSVHSLLEKAWQQDPLMALKLVFQLRDVRSGKNDRENFIVCLEWLYKNHPKTFSANMNIIPEVGCWKDPLDFLVKLVIKAGDFDNQGKKKEVRNKVFLENPHLTDLRKSIAEMFSDAIKKDMDLMKNDSKKLSLASKWAPTQNCHHDLYTGLNRVLAIEYFGSGIMKTQKEEIAAKAKFQRSVLAPLRKYLKITEVFMSANEWSSIEYPLVHASCMKRNNKHFMEKDAERFEDFKKKVASGEAKINASALLPHVIMSTVMYRSSDDSAMEVAGLQWNRYVEDLRKSGSLNNTLAVSDVSGSMSGTPMEVSIALGLLTATLASGPFKDVICTFSQVPEFFKIPAHASLKEKFMAISRMKWGYNTDFQAVFKLILSTAKAVKLDPSEMIKTVIVFSDMQFDCADSSYSKSTHQQLQAQFEREGYTLPNIIYWNLSGGFGNVPVTVNDSGALLLSGFSGQLLKLIMTGKYEAPPSQIELMQKALENPIYEKLKVVD